MGSPARQNIVAPDLINPVQPFSGHLLVFCNKRSDRLKILYWDRDGWVIWYKRLEAGTFVFPFAETGRREIAAWELGVLLEGIDLSKGRRRKRYALPPALTEARAELEAPKLMRGTAPIPTRCMTTRPIAAALVRTSS
jgi:transposase